MLMMTKLAALQQTQQQQEWRLPLSALVLDGYRASQHMLQVMIVLLLLLLA
jgi:hypothetical protein